MKIFLDKVKKEYEAGVVKMLELIVEAGERVSEEQELERKKICDGCEYNGRVEPMPGVIRDGCRECGCPFESKRVMRSLLGRRIKCTHPVEGNKWAEVDNKFVNN